MSFPVSVWYGVGSVTPLFDEETIKRDLKNIKEAGFKYVRGWVNWRDSEPRPGEYDFSGVENLLKTANDIGLRVILQVYLEFAPDWLPKLHPDSLYVSESGSVIMPQGSPGVCLDHPGVRARAEEFMRKLAQVVIKYPNFYVWDLWSEPNVIQWIYQPTGWRGLFCYCNYSKGRFRDWLKTIYGNVNTLNKAWHRSYLEFNDVEPPRFVSLHFARDNIDWLTFNIVKLKEDLEWRVKVIRSIDNNHPVVSHSHGGTSVFSNPLFGEPDDWEMASVVDAWGTSFYPKHAGRVKVDHVLDSLVLDAARSAALASGKPYWIGELQAGQGVGGLKAVEPVTPDDVALWMWQAIAHEAKAINIYHWYPMMLGFESGGYGLINPDGSLTDRARKAGETARVIYENSDLFLKAKLIDSSVAILYNIESYKWLWIAQRHSSDVLSRSILGVYRVLFNSNYNVDLVSIRQVEGNLISKYKVLIAPLSLVMTLKAALGLRNFVSNGGLLLVDSRFAAIRSDGYIDSGTPAYGLSEVIGGYEDGYMSVDKVNLRITSNLIPGLKTGDLIIGSNYVSWLNSKANEVGVSEFNLSKPSITINDYGKGKAIYVGTSIGLSYEANGPGSGVGKLIEGIMNIAMVQPPVEVKSTREGYIEVRIMRSGADYLLFIINHSYGDQLVNVRINENVINVGNASIKDLVTGASISITNNELQLTLRGRQVVVGLVSI
ncbi:beta-galactosidase [Caldivirga maquilingensis]|uniref:beta-galactosidase n=1 Tax=Caldivirga maquilingensis (strain ATCC 700844 / DSM 13496 / JCM 10307 / IC-167) TaxID=397948 RepID=A8M9Q3_CALMQ|nr:beta-galactosidase [Caldivirga maquilingensis]ABW00934.1 Glycoside hydrolase family 42 domain protein [Caldivirga maquilingensis IC-167]